MLHSASPNDTILTNPAGIQDVLPDDQSDSEDDDAVDMDVVAMEAVKYVFYKRFLSKVIFV